MDIKKLFLGILFVGSFQSASKGISVLDSNSVPNEDDRGEQINWASDVIVPEERLM